MSVIRVVKNKKNPYLIMNKTGLNDKRLSLKAKGLLCYLLSKPDNWYVHTKHISNNNTNNITSILSAINELCKFGYMYKHRFRTNNGRYSSYNYLIYESPKKTTPIKTNTQPETVFPVLDNPVMDNQTLLINKTIENIKTSTPRPENKSDFNVAAAEDLNLKKLTKQTTELLYSIGIKNHTKLFSLFSISDIFEYASWIERHDFKMDNPTGFLISAIKENWMNL